MSSGSAYWNLAEREHVLQKKQDLEDMQRNAKYVDVVWNRRQVGVEVLDNINPAVAMYNNINQGPSRQWGRKTISEVNG